MRKTTDRVIEAATELYYAEGILRQERRLWAELKSKYDHRMEGVCLKGPYPLDGPRELCDFCKAHEARGVDYAGLLAVRKQKRRKLLTAVAAMLRGQ